MDENNFKITDITNLDYDTEEIHFLNYSSIEKLKKKFYPRE